MRYQISMEYAITIGFATIILLPALIYFFSELNDLQDSVIEAHGYKILNMICDEAKKVYFLGNETKTRIKFNTNNKFKELLIQNDLLLLTIKFSYGTSFVSKYCDVNLTNKLITLNAGNHILEIKNENYYVNLTLLE